LSYFRKLIFDYPISLGSKKAYKQIEKYFGTVIKEDYLGLRERKFLSIEDLYFRCFKIAEKNYSDSFFIPKYEINLLGNNIWQPRCIDCHGISRDILMSAVILFRSHIKVEKRNLTELSLFSAKDN